MKICVIGAGYVGLVSGACFADCGHEVTCVDLDAAKVAAINAGRSPIHEEGLAAILTRTVGRTLRAVTDLRSGLLGADLVMVAVGTPFANGKIDLAQILGAATQIGQELKGADRFVSVIIKSTVIPGTTDGPFREALERHSGLRAGEGFGIGMNPEFLTEGTAVTDFNRPDRIVLGTLDERTRQILRELYRPWNATPMIECNTRTAEMIKYASNAVLATMISYANEISRLCEAIGDIDVVDVLDGVHQSAYFTSRTPAGPVRAPISSFLGAGCGFGGSCLPKDVSALAAQGRAAGLDMPMLQAVLEVNRTQPERMLHLVRRHHPSLAGLNVAMLGLAFKPDTDDVRESPAWPLLRLLREAGAVVSAFDPVADPWSRPELQGVRRADSLESAVKDAQVVLLVTRWDEFSSLDEVLDRLGIDPLVVDGRRLLVPKRYRRYEGIGRGTTPIAARAGRSAG